MLRRIGGGGIGGGGGRLQGFSRNLANRLLVANQGDGKHWTEPVAGVGDKESWGGKLVSSLGDRKVTK